MVSPSRFVSGYDVRSDDRIEYSERDRPTSLLHHVDSVEVVPRKSCDDEAGCVGRCDHSTNAKIGIRCG